MKTFIPKVDPNNRKWHVLDLEGVVLGREPKALVVERGQLVGRVVLLGLLAVATVLVVRRAGAGDERHVLAQEAAVDRHEVHALLQGDPETGHAGIGDRQTVGPTVYQPLEQRDAVGSKHIMPKGDTDFFIHRS